MKKNIESALLKAAEEADAKVKHLRHDQAYMAIGFANGLRAAVEAIKGADKIELNIPKRSMLGEPGNYNFNISL